MPGKGDGFLRNAFHQIAVGGENIGVMIDEVVGEGRCHDALAERKADGGCEPLSERSGGDFDALRMAEFRVARRFRAHLAEILQIIKRHALCAGEVQKRIEQHGAVTGGEDETITIRPCGIGGIEFQKAGKKHRCNIGSAHRQAGMTGFGLLDAIH